MLSLSQSQLTLLDTCDRKFQYVYFEALSGPSRYEQKVTTQWGTQFHLLMQQRSLNLPTEVLTSANAEMAVSMSALAKAAPEIFKALSDCSSPNHSSANNIESQSEQRRTLAFNGYLLTVVYDWVLCGFDSDPPSGQILDWKTHQRPPRRERLANDWQTRLYLYVLCETTPLSPEQLSMTYWFVRSDASSYRFGYSAQQHEQTRQDLQRLTARLSRMREQNDFPKIAIAAGKCDQCPFNVRCDRHLPLSSVSRSPIDPYHLLQAASQLTADSIEEIPL